MTDTRTRCNATTKSGTRCRLTAQPGSDYCHLHADFASEQASEKLSEETVLRVQEVEAEDDAVVDAPVMEAPELASRDTAASGAGDEHAYVDVDDHSPPTEVPTKSAAPDKSERIGTMSEMLPEAGAEAAEAFDAEESSAEPQVKSDEVDNLPAKVLQAMQSQEARRQESTSSSADEVKKEQAEEGDMEILSEEMSSQRLQTAEPQEEIGDAEHDSLDSPPFDEEPEAEEADTTAAAYDRVTPTPDDERQMKLIAEVQSLALELCKRFDQARLRGITPTQAVELFNQHIGSYAPETQRALFADIQRNLQDARYRDLADPEVLRGLWYILYLALQNQSHDVRQRVIRQLSGVPGFENMSELSWRLQGTSPENGAQKTSSGGIGSAFTVLMQKALRMIRKVLPG